MSWKVSKRSVLRVRPENHPCLCAHPNIAHWSKDGRCVSPGCKCQAFKRKALNKYGAVKAEANGEHFDSKQEARDVTNLRYLLRAGEADFDDIRRQVKFSFDINGVHIANYYADAVVTVKATGKKRVYETKGMRTREYIIKRRLMQALYPEVEFVEVRS